MAAKIYENTYRSDGAQELIDSLSKKDHKDYLKRLSDEQKQSSSKWVRGFLRLIHQLAKQRTFQAGMFFLTISVILLYYMGSNIPALLFSVVGILLFIPMRFVPMLGLELGFTGMLILSSVDGFAMGLIVGKITNIIGHLVTFQLDADLIYEFFIYVPIAFVASLFPIEFLLPVGITLILLYNIGYVIYFYVVGLLNAVQISYSVTNALFNIFVLTQLIPFFL